MTTLRAARQDRTDALRVCQSTGDEVQAALAGQTRRWVAAEGVGAGLRDALDQAHAEAARLASELAVAGAERVVLDGALADAGRHAALARDDLEAARQRLAQTEHALAERDATVERMV